VCPPGSSPAPPFRTPAGERTSQEKGKPPGE